MRLARSAAALLLLVAALGSSGAAPPTTCGEFAVKGDDAVTCAVTLSEGYTYQFSTACDSVSGQPVLRLLDELANEVAYNDGFPHCGGNVTAALVEYFYPCYAYAGATSEFAVSVECIADTSCSGRLEVETSSKVPPEDCRRPSPPPPPAATGSDYVFSTWPSPPFAPLSVRAWNGTVASTGRHYSAYAATLADVSKFSFALPPDGCAKHTPPSTSSQLFDCEIATNAGFFTFTPPTCEGNTLLDGAALTWQSPESAVFGVTTDGRTVLGYISTPSELPLQSAVSGKGWLVRDGKPFVTKSREFQPEPHAISFVTEKAPRTAAAVLPGGAVALVVVDGCEVTDEGFDLFEFAEVLIGELGAVQAVNLDGGGSSVMVRGGEWVSRPTCNDSPTLCERDVTTIACLRK